MLNMFIDNYSNYVIFCKTFFFVENGGIDLALQRSMSFLILVQIFKRCMRLWLCGTSVFTVRLRQVNLSHGSISILIDENIKIALDESYLI